MKKIYILFLLPLLVATTCEDDDVNSGFESHYIIQNDSSTDLILFTEGGGQLSVVSQTELFVASDFNNTTDPISPSESAIFNNIKLYKVVGENFILVYNQSPIDDSLWVFNEPSGNRFEYRLVITDELVD
ncbi:hypothetical protein FBALC1_05648 [Flavobacteriales bacterium ALC-1]|nr:hypothetical protein FBALC1_05648 [Flavobacteriales bacterium ALC-1]